MSSLLLLCFLLPVFDGVKCAGNETSVIEHRYASFTNDPTIEGGQLATTRDKWTLFVSARFANDCLADTGVVPEYVDLSPAGGAEVPSTRVVWLRQSVNPGGCPDTYMPVTRRIAVPMGPAATVRSVIVLNASTAFSAGLPGLQAHVFAVGDAPLADGEVDHRVRAVELALADWFPTFQNVSLQTRPGAAGYSLEFDVVAPTRRHLDSTPVAWIRQQVDPSESGVTDDWLLVFFPGASRLPEAPGPTVRQRYRIVTSERAVGAGHLVIIVNPVVDSGQQRAGPFTVLTVR